MPRTAANGIEIEYDTFGDAKDPALLLVMGFTAQLIAWDEGFCQALADKGFHVIRFDNRDCGLSTHLNHLPPPNPTRLLLRRETAPYSIDDMAADTVGLLDALGLESADIVGASMGGFIAQSVALHSSHRVRSLTLMMTSTGSRRVGYPAPKVARQLLRRRGVGGREEAIALTVSVFRLIGSPAYALDEEYLQQQAGLSYDRAYDPKGYLRQLAACLVQPDRTARLRELHVPTLVLHGLNDPLVSSTGGLALARAIPGARFVGYSGMGHDLPRALWPEFAHEIVRLADSARTAPEDRAHTG
jgi:pimeloyl-ACP methyl ester carboxylesterase